MLGHAQSSPIVSGATVWKARTKRVSRSASSRPSPCRISSSAIAWMRALPESSRAASFGSFR